MGTIKNTFIQFLRDEEGATALEYAMFVALISVAILAGLGGTIQQDLTAIFQNISAQINQAATSASGGAGS